MSVACCEVHEAAFGEKVELPAVLLLEFLDILAHGTTRYGDFLKLGDVDFHIEVTGVRHHSAVFHDLIVMLANDILIARQGQKDVANARRLVHRHDTEAIEHSFDRLDGIDLRDDDIRPETLSAHGAAFAAPAVTGNDNGFARDAEVRRAHDAVPR